MDKQPSFRQAMDYLHTWAGVLFSVLLFLVFFMGTLSVFDKEIDRWMMPTTRLPTPAAVSFDTVALPQLQKLAPQARLWTVQYSNSREPLMSIGWVGAQGIETRLIDVGGNVVLADPGSKGATGFFYPFHFSFHIQWLDLGYWLLALVAIAMLVLLVTGVVIHRKVFADFFTFRPGKSMQRATLDLHNASSVLLLPFHFIITLSGLIIFLFIYMEAGMSVVYATDGASVIKEATGFKTRPAAREAAQLASVDAMVLQARNIWGGGEVRRVIVRNPGDRNALVEVQRRPHDQVVNDNVAVTFEGVSGQVWDRQRLAPAMRVQRFFSGLHMLSFDHWGLRWMYFMMGLVSAVMIATGLLLWVEKRRVRQERLGRISYRVVNAVAAAGTVGVLLATLAMLVANKLLPAALEGRAQAEQTVFFAAWGLALCHALVCAFPLRSGGDLRMAWRGQAWTCAVLALCAMLLNAVVTGDNLLHSIGQGRLAVAGTDLVLLATAALALAAGRRLKSPSSATQAAPVSPGPRVEA
jgi:uncharacterized iron-regulated membrane protein